MSKLIRQELVVAVARAVAELQNATEQVDTAVAERMGINHTDRRCLGALFDQGPTGAGQLAAVTKLSPAAMTVALDRLERLGYVRRVRSEADRRSVIAELTPKARQLIEALYGPIGREGMARLEQYSDAELTLLRDFLREGRDLQLRHAARIRPEVGAPKEADDEAPPTG